MQVEDFRSHVATDGSLLGATGKWRACGWAVAQLDSHAWDACMGCVARWRQNLGSSAPSRGRS